MNFAFLQRDGVPTGPVAPQDPSVNTFLPNGQTLQMNPETCSRCRSVTRPVGS